MNDSVPYIEALFQRKTYSGFMMGSLSVVNEVILATLKDRFIPDEFRHINCCPLQVDKYQAVLDEELPGVATVAILLSDKSTKKSESGKSALAVVWFQSDFFLPIPSQVQEEIKLLDWERLATDLT